MSATEHGPLTSAELAARHVRDALSQDPSTALGAQDGEARLREVVTAAGSAHFRRAAETPFNFVLEARR